MQYFYSQKQFEEYQYRQALRKDTNAVGLLLILFFGTEILFSIVVAIVEIFSGANTTEILSSAFELMMFNGVFSLVTFFLVGIIFCLVRRESFARLFPFEKIKPSTLFMLVIIGLALSLLSNYVADAVSHMFSMFGFESSYTGSVETDERTSIFISYLTVAVIPAFAEEFAFRGIVMGILRRHSDALALIVSAAIFGIMHGNIIQIPFAFCGGLVFGFMVIKTNSLLPGILIHFLNNAIATTCDLLTEVPGITDDMVNIGFSLLILILIVLSAIFLFRIIKNDKNFFSFTDSDKMLPFREKMKITCSSPTLIVYTALMAVYTVFAETMT